MSNRLDTDQFDPFKVLLRVVYINSNDLLGRFMILFVGSLLEQITEINH